MKVHDRPRDLLSDALLHFLTNQSEQMCTKRTPDLDAADLAADLCVPPHALSNSLQSCQTHILFPRYLSNSLPKLPDFALKSVQTPASPIRTAESS